MAMRGRRSSFRTQHSFRPTYQDFQPKSDMKENQDACFLHIQLHGFTKERIRIQFEDSSRTVKISGERPIDGGNRRSRFRQSYTVPQICDTNKIQSNFSQGILTITMPKKLVSQEKAPIPPNKAQDFIPPNSAREEELGDKKSVASSSSSSKDPNGLKGQKSQEEALSQRPFDGQKAEKELREKDEKGKEKIEHKPKITMVGAPKRHTEDNKTQNDQEKIGPKPTSKVEAQERQEESEMKPQITMVGAPERQIDGKPQRVLEETKSEPPFKIAPRKLIDDKSQKVQEEIVQKPKITMVEGPREQRDSKPQRIQEETELEPTLKIAPRKSIDDKPQKSEEGIVQKPKITMEEGPRKQTNGKLQRVLEETEPESTLKISPRKSIDDKPQKPKITMAEGSRKQTYGKPQRFLEETGPEPPSKIAPKKSTDDNPQKGQEEIMQKPEITMVESTIKQTDGKPQGIQEEIKQNTTLTTIPKKQANQKIAGKRDEDAQPCESRKPEEGVVEKSMIKEKEIKSRREIAKEDELFAPKTLAKVNNHNNDMIGTIEKGIKEVVTSASQALTRIAEGKWDNEDKPLLINMGVSALVLATLGMYAFYRFSSSERT